MWHSKEAMISLSQVDKEKKFNEDITMVRERLLTSGFTEGHFETWNVNMKQFNNHKYSENIEHIQNEIEKLQKPGYLIEED